MASCSLVEPGAGEMLPRPSGLSSMTEGVLLFGGSLMHATDATLGCALLRCSIGT